MRVLKIDQFKKLVGLSLQNLKSHFRSVDGKHGWHQYLGNNKIGNIATSQALILLDIFNEDFDKKHLAVEFISNSQLVGSGNTALDGGWTYVTNFSDLPTTEATCWALLGLFPNYRDSKTASDGIEWLLNNHIDINNDIGWGTIKADVCRVYSTCLALRVLHQYGRSNTPQFERGLSWLFKSQNSDFGWGEQFGYASTVTHTSHAIITICEVRNTDTHYVVKGTEWLLENFVLEGDLIPNKAGYQEIIEFDNNVDGKVNHQRLLYYHMPVPYGLIALIKTGHFNSNIVFDGFNSLLKSNNHGYWVHPHFADDKRKPLWLIFDVLSSFKALAENCPDWNRLLIVQLKKNRLVFINSTNPFSPQYFFNNFIVSIWGKSIAIIILCVIITKMVKLIPNFNDIVYVNAILVPLVVELLAYYIIEVRRDKKDSR